MSAEVEEMIGNLIVRWEEVNVILALPTMDGKNVLHQGIDVNESQSSIRGHSRE